MISAKIEGGAQLASGLTAFNKEIDKAIKRGVDRTALVIETGAKKKLKADGHIITGRLFSSIHAETKEGQSFNYKTKSGASFDGSLGQKIAADEAVIGTNVEYAPCIEYGTKNFSGDSFLGYAALQQKEKLKDRIQQEINKVIKKFSK